MACDVYGAQLLTNSDHVTVVESQRNHSQHQNLESIWDVACNRQSHVMYNVHYPMHPRSLLHPTFYCWPVIIVTPVSLRNASTVVASPHSSSSLSSPYLRNTHPRHPAFDLSSFTNSLNLVLCECYSSLETDREKWYNRAFAVAVSLLELSHAGKQFPTSS